MPRLFPKLILLSFLALAACQSVEERAARFYQSGLTLLEAGQIDQALVEFRNVMAADPKHVAARLAYADAQRARGNIADAYGQYLRLAEQDPENVAARVALSEIAILSNGWDDAETYGRAVAALRPADPAVITVTAMLDYRAAVLAQDNTGRAAPAAVARKVLQDDPGSVIARKIIIDNNILNGDIPDALATVEAGLAIDPTQLELHAIRVGLLSGSGNTAGAQAALEDMAAQFPNKLDVRQQLIGWYIDQDDLPAAEAYLRRLATAPDASPNQKVTVVDFLQQTQGPLAAISELDQLIADAPDEATPDNRRYRALRAAILFAQDQRDTAIAEMKAIAASDDGSDTTRDYKIVLAQMLLAQNDEAGARAIVTEVLAEDAGHVEALKISAQWLIAADDPDAAIIALRQALAQAPRDIALITLLGNAHARAGDHDLAGERYALSVEISGQAAQPSQRYAQFLLERNRADAAEAVIANALTVAPQDIELLTVMAEIQMRQSAWNSVTRIVWKLRAIGTPVASDIADGIQVELLKRQDRYEDTTALLQEMIADGNTSMAAKAQLVEAQVRAGRLDEARAFLSEQLAEQPDDLTLRFLQAGTLVLIDDMSAAETAYRALLKGFPGNEQVLRSFYVMLTLQGREDDADALLDQVLVITPEAPSVNMLKAGRLEAQGDFEAAIAIYEMLYTKDSSNQIVANNLASMITARRDDADSLARAYAIAARLRGTDVPQFQDTLGWIAYRRSKYQEALSYLEPAAQGLPDDALTQFHLGMTFDALERPADARRVLTQAVALGKGTGLAQLDTAREVLARLPE